MDFSKRYWVVNGAILVSCWDTFYHAKKHAKDGAKQNPAGDYRVYRVDQILPYPEKAEPPPKKKWLVDCLDTFSHEWYGRREFTSEATATKYAQDRKAEIEKQQPSASAGSIQDRVYVTSPDNVQREVSL
jgi:hypothetical protein